MQNSSRQLSLKCCEKEEEVLAWGGESVLSEFDTAMTRGAPGIVMCHVRCVAKYFECDCKLRLSSP